MKLHLIVLQFILAILFIFVFPIYHVMSAQTATVDIIEFKFVPQEITVKVGDSVRWTNREKRQYHSVWFEKLGEPEPDYLFPDDSYQRRFDQAGNFPYRCGPHPEMTGVVHVQ